MKPAILAPLAAAALFLPSFATASPTDWPAATPEAKPWIQWPSWTTMTESQIGEATSLVRQSGFGGIVLHQRQTPEKSPSAFSTDWTAQLSRISQAATTHELGVDLAEFSLGDWQLASTLTPIDQEIEGGGPFQIRFPAGKLEVLRAYSPEGKSVNLAPLVKKGRLHWKAPAGKWRVLGLFSNTRTGRTMLDPLSVASTRTALTRFEQALGKKPPTLRARLHPAIDSASPIWSVNILTTFSSKRGYDLRSQLPAFFGIGEPDAIARVRADYRQTLDELYRSHLRTWQQAATLKKIPTRLQTQDALGNIIDQAALADIPEILVTQSVTAAQFPRFLLATSGAHLTGKPLASASVQAKDLQLKQTVDELWLAGVNHLILDTAPPPLFTQYITRIQSFLQSGTPSARLLVYYPDADLWNSPADPSTPDAFSNSTFYHTVTSLHRAGIAFDVISDQLLLTATTKDSLIQLNDRSYQGLILPEIGILPETTAKKLADLTKAGMKLGVAGTLPTTVPGFANVQKRTLALTQSLATIPAGQLTSDKDVRALAYALGVPADPIAEPGLRAIRRDLEDGSVYFLVNPHPHAVDTWLPLGVPFATVVMFDPMNPERHGIAPIRHILGNPNIRLILAPGESRILRTSTEPLTEGKNWQD
ncbi:MAG: glycosyl hydrolase [Luteolibacter sp.]